MSYRSKYTVDGPPFGRDKFCDFPFAFLPSSFFYKSLYSKRKDFFPKGSTFFFLLVDPFQNRDINNFDSYMYHP